MADLRVASLLLRLASHGGLVCLVGGGGAVTDIHLILILTPEQTAVGVFCPGDAVNMAGEARVLSIRVLEGAVAGTGDLLTTLRALEVSHSQEALISDVISKSACIV